MTGEMAHSDAVRMRVPFDPASAAVVRDELRSWLARQGTDEATVEDARQVASELVGNALRHASPLEAGVVLVGWRSEGGRLDLEVSDGGGPTIPQQRHAAPDEIGGRGLQIVSALADRWWVDAGPGVNTVHAVLPLQGSGAQSN